VVDDFGIKYTDKADVDHLINALKQHYQITEDWEGKRYCGLTLDWDYVGRTCDISMPGYIEQALKRFHYPTPTKPQHAPHYWQPPSYGASTQYSPEPDDSPLLEASEI
jgi:hypothetical protein